MSVFYLSKNKIKIFILFFYFTFIYLNCFLLKINYFLTLNGGILYKTIAIIALLFIFTLSFFLFILVSISGLFTRIALGSLIYFSVVTTGIYYDISNGNQMSFSDFHMIINSIDMYSNAFHTYKNKIIYNILFPLPLLLTFLYKVNSFNNKAKVKFNLSSWSIYLLLTFSVSFIVFFKKTGEGTKGIPEFLFPLSYSIDYVLDANFSNIKINDRKLPKKTDNIRVSNIILIVDESINYSYIDINKIAKESSKANMLYDLSPAYSYSNLSQYSNILIRKMARYDHEIQDARSDLGIWDLMKNQGYENYILDAQGDANGHDFFSKKEMKNVNIIPSKHTTNDNQLADLLINLLNDKKNEKKFILVMKKGAHFPYILPDSCEIIYKPVMSDYNMRKERKDIIINTYKNLVSCNTDSFIKKISEYQKNDTAIIYTSDHGQNFDDLDKKFTHGNNINPTIDEGIVPFFILGNNLNNFKVTSNIINSDFHSHYDIPYILMDLSGYDERQINKFLGDRIKKSCNLGYLYNNVYGFFSGMPLRQPVFNCNK
ncbi:sulfatase-like hydrolase/transferase [Xenorhabdus sp. ZM]|uniref:sulfatase-like hydrolase/transferase n=1 Tax=Xenorhabdus szentirmaii TaxID=290112 RepID=UPI0019C8F3A6|nr:sulfatase-like hydrolase/transferase [Xenorhabdus sp. ZM]MBD2804168.1 sulfatase-like hydrolase/transferase [Xenorhabdus sp. ZM]